MKKIVSRNSGSGDMFESIDKGTVLFLDEIHRFNKTQQDYLLPYVENGMITLIGATTENPSYEVIPALLSRMQVFTLKPLNETEVEQVIDRACEILDIEVDDESV